MALLHAQQLAAVMLNDEPQLAAMVSRSADGALLVPALRLRGVVPGARLQPAAGSRQGWPGRPGRAGPVPAPRLPSAHRRGRAARAARERAPGRRAPGPPHGRGHPAGSRLAARPWVLTRTWDRMQLPRPFSRLQLVFAAPIEPGEAGADPAVRAALAASLAQLEAAPPA